MTWQEQLRAAQAATDRAIRQRQAELRRFADQAEAAGRQVYADTIKTSQKVLARTPAELRALGVAAIKGQLPQALGNAAGKTIVKAVERAAPRKAQPAAKPRAAPMRSKSVTDEIMAQGGAAARGAIDEVTFGLADTASAGAQTLLAGGLDGFGERFNQELAEERAADAYDEQHYGLARGSGRVAGFVGSLALTGGAGAGVKAGARVVLGAKKLDRAAKAANKVKRIAALNPRGLTGLAVGGGAVGGVAGQATSDVISGDLSSLQEYGGAGLGGATAALLLRAPRVGSGKAAEAVHRLVQNPRTVGGVEGAATAAYQGALEGRDVGLGEVANAARAGVIGGQFGDVAGKYGANALPRRAKEELGDNLSILKSVSEGEGLSLLTQLGPKRRAAQNRQVAVPLPGGGSTRADHVTDTGRAIEAKFGAYARLEPRQIQARHELDPNRYQINHFLPTDIGRMAGVYFGAAGSGFFDRDN
jgi:hypothetical protein